MANVSALKERKNHAIAARGAAGRKLKRLNIDLLMRLMAFLYYNSKTKRTNIAMNCGMSYDKCLLYLDWMGALSLTRTESQHGFELLSLSERGMDFFEKNFKHA